MNYAMAKSGVDVASGFLEDCNVHGRQVEWEHYWRDKLEVLRALTYLGFMINLHKCKILMDNILILGLNSTYLALLWG